MLFAIFSYGEEKISLHSVSPNTNAESSSSEDSDTLDSIKTTLNKKVRRDKIIIYWLSYRDGLQRVLLFTQEQRIANYVIKKKFHEYCDIEAFFSFSGFGLSIFTNADLRKEHIYASICDTPAVWEVNIGQKWKILTLELASWLEDKYRLHYKKCQLKDYVHIDFEKMFMLKPFFAELKRTYVPGVYLQYRKSNSYQYLDFKMQSVQVDNKQCSPSAGIILQSIPSDNIRAQNPFFELNVFRNSFGGYSVYKLIKLTVGDFNLNIDDSLFVHFQNLYGDGGRSAPDNVSLYRNDMAYIHAPLGSNVKI